MSSKWEAEAAILGVDTHQVNKCARKRAYPYRTHAVAAAKKVQANTGQKIGVYPCPYCRQWHVGKKPR